MESRTLRAVFKISCGGIGASVFVEDDVDGKEHGGKS